VADGKHLEVAEVLLDKIAEPGTPDKLAEQLTQMVIAESLVGILELLTGVIGDRGSVVDVRVQGSVSTGDQR
jgi:hypothetical protein